MALIKKFRIKSYKGDETIVGLKNVSVFVLLSSFTPWPKIPANIVKQIIIHKENATS